MASFLPFEVPEQKRIRVIVDTDAKNEADDQFAIVHALLTPRFEVVGIVAAHFGTGRTALSMEESYAECRKLLGLLEERGRAPLVRGAAAALVDEDTPARSEGADLIIREALQDDPRPLFVLFLGPLTDLASALLLEPSIARRFTAVWIGGGSYPLGEREFNLQNDIAAANRVFDTAVPLWQVPRDVYVTMRVSLAELCWRMAPLGAVGAYLVQQMVDFNAAHGDNPRFPKGEMWSLGDSPAVSLLLDDHEYQYSLVPAPRFRPDMSYIQRPAHPHRIRVYRFVDPRFTLEDLYAKVALFARRKELQDAGR